MAPDELALKLPKPKRCAEKSLHNAEVRFWIENGRLRHDEKIAPSIRCYLADIDWDKQWKRFRRGRGYSLCLCKSAAIKAGLIY